MFEKPTTKFVAFMQLWRYFGVIRAAFPSAAMKRLTRVEANGRRVVDTTNLVSMIDEFIRSNYKWFDENSEALSSVASLRMLGRRIHIDAGVDLGSYKDARFLSKKKVSLHRFLAAIPVDVHARSLIAFG